METQRTATLVRAVASGDAAAFNELYEAYSKSLYSHVRYLVHDADVVESVVQDAFMQLYLHAGSITEPEHLGGWLRTTATRLAGRYGKADSERRGKELDDDGTAFATIEEENTEFLPTEALEDEELKQILMDMLEALPPEQAAAAHLCYKEGYSVAQIAAIQGVSEGTVKSRLNYARRSLKKAVTQYEEKHQIRLHAIPFIPLFRLLFAEDAVRHPMPIGMAESIAHSLAAETAAAGAAAATTTGTTTTASGTATAAATTGGKAAGSALAVKIAATATAAALVVTGIGAAIALRSSKNIPADTDAAVTAASTTTASTQQDAPFHAGDVVIPTGGVYYCAESGEELVGADTAAVVFPDTPQEGDVYVYGEYRYTYSEDRLHLYSYEVCDGSGWSAAVLDSEQTAYDMPLRYIGRTPMTHMINTYFACTNMVTAPDIPATVTCLYGTYKQCESMRVSPRIPDGVVDLCMTYIGCEALETAPYIPASVKCMSSTFARAIISDSLLHGTTVVVDADPVLYDSCFSGLSDITVTGATSLKEELEATMGYW